MIHELHIEYYYKSGYTSTILTEVKVDIQGTEPQKDHPKEQSSSLENEGMLYLFNSWNEL